MEPYQVEEDGKERFPCMEAFKCHSENIRKEKETEHLTLATLSQIW